MSRSRRVNRSSPSARVSNPDLDSSSEPTGFFGRLRRRLSGTGRLADEAGRAGGFIEPLEKRELLFSLTITPSDVGAGGVGTVEATFAYAIPYLNPTQEVSDVEPQDRLEDFQDEAAGGIFNGRVMQGSFFRFFHNITPPADIQVIDNTGTGGDGTKYMQVRQDATGDFWTLRIAVSQENPNSFLAANSVSFNVQPRLPGGTGLLPDNYRVDLRMQGQIVASFTGDALRAINPSPRGVGTFTFTGTAQNPAFDELTISALVSGNDAYIVDDINARLPAGRFAGIVASHVFAATVVFSGPVGSSVQVLDLYGREMIQTIAAGLPPTGSQVTLIDPDDDGRPNFNDGIGRIVLSGTDSRSNLTIWGGTLTATTTRPTEDTDFLVRTDGRLWDGNFVATVNPDVMGLYGTFESAGFGYFFDGQSNTALGLPPGPGSVIIGSPWVRSAATSDEYNPGGRPVVRDEFGRLVPVPQFVTDGFSRPDQGVFVLGGASMGSVQIHGIVHGSSNFTGALERFAAGYLVGSVSVAGDLGILVSGSDAGLWVPDPQGVQDPIDLDAVYKTKAQLVVGRTVGQIAIAGRSLLDVTVQGDLSSPQTRPPRNIFNYSEQEYAYGLRVDAQVPAVIQRTLINNQLFLTPGLGGRAGAQAVVFGNGFMRNDSLLSAEWVGNSATGVNISGELGYGDPVNTGEDTVDVYAFPTDGTQPVVVQFDAGSAGALYVRIMDINGRTVAANNVGQSLQIPQFMKFNPDAPGIYYLVISGPGGDPYNNGRLDDQLGTGSYSLTLTGLAPTTLGSYRTGAGNGEATLVATATNTINVLSGSIGSIRIGTGFVNGAGQEQDPQVILNTEEDSIDDVMSFRGGTFSTPANLYNVTVGADVLAVTAFPVNIFVGGNFGSLITGQSPIAGIGATEGDVSFFNLTVGGSIALVDIKGGIGIEQDASPFTLVGGLSHVNFVTGTAGGRGDIGWFRTGSHILGDTMSIRTSPGSTIGGFMVAQDVVSDPGDLRTGIFQGNDGVKFTTGVGSDVRFVSFPRLDLRTTVDSAFNLIGGQTVELIDDGGGVIRIRPVNVPNGFFVGRVQALPIDGSQGVAVGDITIDLSQGLGGLGASLEIEGVGPVGSSDVITIGRIVITGSAANSGVTIKGNVQTDVWRIVQTGGAPLLFIRNETPMGDIVAADVIGLTTLDILTGDLGRTQVPAWGPKLIGPFLGIAAGAQAAPNAALGIPQNIMSTVWGGTLYRAPNDMTTAVGAARTEDIGAPFDPYLNGLVVRTGNIDDVRVGGATGDVIVQNGDIARVNANFDRKTPQGRFDGIVGTIYANNIFLVTIGDGLMQRDLYSPFATTGIFAADDIVQVLGQDIPGQYISSVISASNNVIETGDPSIFNGIDTIDLQGGGDYIDAFISSENADAFWTSPIYGEGDQSRGDIRFVTGAGADMFRSQIIANNVINVVLTGGFYDASSIHAVGGTITRVEAAGFRNSTLTGSELEFRVNEIFAGLDLGTLTTTGRTGDIVDLVVDVVGVVINEISARNIIRSKIDVDNAIAALTVTENMRASAVTAGQLSRFAAGRNVQSSSFTISGAIPDFSAGNAIINTSITVTGPFGRIDKISAPNLISGEITSTGPITRIESTAGDIVATITTTTGRGNVVSLSAGRDLDIRTDIAGSLSTLTAGRHIGNRNSPGVILVRGNLTSATMGGQLYSDLRVGQSVTGAVTIGPVTRLPDLDLGGSGSIIAFGAISSVIVVGDFGGDIISYSGGIKSVAITGGSFLPGRTIAAYDGSIDSVVITGGNLYGNIHADYILTSVQVVASADGVFGDIGVNPFLSSGAAYDALRNQLPVGVVATAQIQGPRISAGQNIGSIITTNGSMFETTIIAGYAIGSIEIHGDVRNDTQTSGRGTAIIAGDLISAIGVFGDFFNAHVLAGVTDLGADGRPGGRGANADSVKSGVITAVGVAGNAADVIFGAGLVAGADGLYTTADDRTALGISFIDAVSVAAGAELVRVFADSLGSVTADPRFIFGGFNTPNEDPEIAAVGPFGTPVVGSLPFDVGGERGVIYFAGPGEAYFDAATRKITLLNTSTASALTITSETFTLTDFDIVTNNAASIGTIFIDASLFGDSDIVIDGAAGKIAVRDISGTGSMRIGGDLGEFASGNFTGGSLRARVVGGIVVNGDFGDPDYTVRGEARISVMTAGGITITGVNRGTINVDRDLTGFVAGAGMQGATLRAGGSISTITTPLLSRSWISVRDIIGSVAVAGDMFDSSIMAGGDLGNDAEFGGTGLAADRVTSGFIGSVTIGGSFRESDIVAGSLRGNDGFFGSSDDRIADGRSSIGAVTIGVAQVGSTRQSESYRISSTGFMGPVTIGGAPGQATDNFAIESLNLMPLALQVTDLQVTEDARVYTARIFFNQPVDASTIARALSISELRGRSDVEIRLIQGIDYTLAYDPATRSVTATFSRNVTEHDLPQIASKPGPGVYRFEILQDVIKAQLVNQRLDGDGDGIAEAADDYSQDDIVGDAGDKLVPERDTVTRVGSAPATIDMYGPFSLDIVLDNNQKSDGLAEANKTFTLRGSIGDHQDNDVNNFRFASDLDLYSITLQAGQILRLGALSGPALLSQVRLISPTGELLPVLDVTDETLPLPVQRPLETEQSVDYTYLIKTTGTYTLLIGNAYTADQLQDDFFTGKLTDAQFNQLSANGGFAYDMPGFVPNLDPVPGGMGDYALTIHIFDDGDTGFAAPTDAGDGAPVVNAPAPSSFAGGDRVLGTADDLRSIVIGAYTFTLAAGPDGVVGTADDLVSGGTNQIFSTQTGDGTLRSIINGSIGPAMASGVPVNVYPDADVYHLNNRGFIAPGTRMRITVRLNEFGTDLGSRNQLAYGSDQFNLDNFRGAVQFGLFDTTFSTSVDDASLVFSPSDFSPNGGTPNTVIAGDSRATYGYDANGDFFIDFLVPGRPGADGKTGTADDLASKYAIYLQGVYNGDYQIQVDTFGATAARITPRRQNILLEAGGGTINWLEKGGLTTKLGAFSTSPIGFSGKMPGGQTVDQYVLTNVRDSLQSMFNAAGLDVRFSLDPHDFEFQEFSTIYLTSTVDPVSLLFNTYVDPRGLIFGGGAIQPFGFSQHSDPFNADHSDEGVVFVPSLATLGYTPAQTDINRLAASTANAVARRVGELMGARITVTNAFTSRDAMAASSVTDPLIVGAGFTLPAGQRLLSNPFDTVDTTDFYLGAQSVRTVLGYAAGR